MSLFARRVDNARLRRGSSSGGLRVICFKRAGTYPQYLVQWSGSSRGKAQRLPTRSLEGGASCRVPGDQGLLRIIQNGVRRAHQRPAAAAAAAFGFPRKLHQVFLCSSPTSVAASCSMTVFHPGGGCNPDRLRGASEIYFCFAAAPVPRLVLAGDNPYCNQHNSTQLRGAPRRLACHNHDSAFSSANSHDADAVYQRKGLLATRRAHRRSA